MPTPKGGALFTSLTATLVAFFSHLTTTHQSTAQHSTLPHNTPRHPALTTIMDWVKDKMNTAAGGGKSSEKDEDGLDKGKAFSLRTFETKLTKRMKPSTTYKRT